MGKVVTSIAALLLLALTVFVLCLIGTIVGSLSGWAVGLLFGETILGIFAAFGLKGFSMWQIGAFLGFVGGFFRTSVTSKSND